MVNEEQHLQAIILLIMQKRGLESLELFGMADTMALWVNGAVHQEHFALTFPPDVTCTSPQSTLGGRFSHSASAAVPRHERQTPAGLRRDRPRF
jgi:hypothetical protein